MTFIRSLVPDKWLEKKFVNPDARENNLVNTPNSGVSVSLKASPIVFSTRHVECVNKGRILFTFLQLFAVVISMNDFGNRRSKFHHYLQDC